MADHPALHTLRRVEQAYRAGSPRDAFALAEAAWDMVRDLGANSPQVLGLATSWYGFLKARIDGDLRGGIKLVRDASEIAFWEPRIFFHLADLYMRLGRRSEALEVVERGLRVSPGDVDLCRMRRMLGVRQAPAVPFLHRSNPVNRWVGKLRHRWGTAAPPARKSSPAPSR
jgi:tetratricopeptide (TPR) repeat protein